MRTLAEYLGLQYEAKVRQDQDGDWIARIEELEGCVAHGSTREEALRLLDEAKEVWIRDALENAHEIPEPVAEEDLPSGRWLQRVPRSLHKKLSWLAKVEDTSLNQLVSMILANYVGQRSPATHGLTGSEIGRPNRNVATGGVGKTHLVIRFGQAGGWVTQRLGKTSRKTSDVGGWGMTTHIVTSAKGTFDEDLWAELLGSTTTERTPHGFRR